MYRICATPRKTLMLILFFTFQLLSAQDLQLDGFKQRLSIKYVNTTNLKLKEKPTDQSETIAELSYLEKIAITRSLNRNGQSWYEVIYPHHGFINSNKLISEKELDELGSKNEQLKNMIKESSKSWSLSTLAPQAERQKYKAEGIEGLYSDKQNIGNVYIFAPNTEIFNADSVKLAWCNSFDKNQDGYLSFSGLCMNLNNTDKGIDKLRLKLYIREENEDDYYLYFTSKEFEYTQDGNAEQIQLNVGIEGHELERGKYNFRLDIYESDNSVLLASIGPSHKELSLQKFETEKYDASEVEFENEISSKPILLNEPAIEVNDHLISLFGFAAVKTIPVEKHFEIDKIFYSGGIEYTKSNWFMGVGAEFTNMLKAMNTDSTRFSTNVYSLYAKFSLTRFAEYMWDFTIDPDLDIYADFGGTYWETNFQKIKYSTIKEDYNLEMKSKGYGYLLGFGARYHLYNFILGVQYHLYHSSETEFSKTVEYTTFDGQKFDIIDTYNVFPGFQQIQILLGYRIRL